ncbi:hypothetical protein, partial [Paracoccus denitrificans]
MADVGKPCCSVTHDPKVGSGVRLFQFAALIAMSVALCCREADPGYFSDTLLQGGTVNRAGF